MIHFLYALLAGLLVFWVQAVPVVNIIHPRFVRTLITLICCSRSQGWWSEMCYQRTYVQFLCFASHPLHMINRY